MNFNEFLLEEYKTLSAEKLQLRESYTRLERITFAGIAIVYAFLLLNIDKITPWVWPTIPFLVTIAAVRSFGFYFAINWGLDQYILDIEKAFYRNFSGGLRGYQHRHENSRIFGIPSRWVNVGLVNGTGWFLVLAFTILATVWRFKFYTVAVPYSC